MEKLEKEIYLYFPERIKKVIKQNIEENNLENTIREIRIRANKNIILKMEKDDIIINYLVTQSEILQILEKLCENSVYAYKKQICEGFITIKGGHRIGLTGTAVTEETGNIINLKYITSLNFRIAREVLNCSDKIIKTIIDYQNNNILNTLIVSPPGKGKTTILRDIVRKISNGMPEINFKGKTIGLVDERGEIAAMYHGIPQNDVGVRTDVIENVSKSKGMKMLVRSMAPSIIACDEVGSKEDIEAITQAMVSGVKGIFTMHGKNMKDIENNKEVYKLVLNKQIEKIIFI